jgi:hypothetical protein
MKIWESEEFDHMLAIVNDEEPKACTTTFLNKILQKESTTTTEANNESDNFPGEKNIHNIKKTLSPTWNPNTSKIKCSIKKIKR